MEGSSCAFYSKVSQVASQRHLLAAPKTALLLIRYVLSSSIPNPQAHWGLTKNKEREERVAVSPKSYSLVLFTFGATDKNSLLRYLLSSVVMFFSFRI